MSQLVEATNTINGQRVTIKIDERHRECYRLRLAGKSIEDLAAHFKVDKRSVYRWLESYSTATVKALESTPVLNLITDRLELYQTIVLEFGGHHT